METNAVLRCALGEVSKSPHLSYKEVQAMNIMLRFQRTFLYTGAILICSFFTAHSSSAETVGPWLFDEGKGAVAKDVSRNGHD